MLTDEFIKAGHQVVVFDLLKRGSDGIANHFNNDNFTLINADFMSSLLPLVIMNCDLVIHLAAIVGDPACAAEPELATKINVEGTKYVVDTCNKYNKRLFFASTGSIYGSNPKACDEKTTPNPLSHYAHTKLEAEHYIQKHAKNALIFRFGTMYGVSPNMRYDLVVNRLVRDAKQTSSFNVFDGTQYRPFLHPKDLAWFFESLFNRNTMRYNGEVFNLVSENLMMQELGELIERVIPTAQMNLVPEKEDDRTYICKSFKAHLHLDFQPKIRVMNGVQEIEREFIKLDERAREVINNEI